MLRCRLEFVQSPIKRQSSEKLRGLLPWYVNGTLAASERQAVEAWLRGSPEARAELAAVQQVCEAARRQPRHVPSPGVQTMVMARVHEQAARRSTLPAPWLRWAWGAAMAAATLLVLWLTIQPGVALQWTVNDGPLTAFRVYRAPAGSAEFALLRELPARPEAQQYTYVDTLLAPWQTYVYRVEGISLAGQSILSQAIAGRAWEALPYQLAILVLSLLAGMLAVRLARQVWDNGWAGGNIPRPV